MIIDEEQNKRLSIEQGRTLLKNTSLNNLNDVELEEVLNAVQQFCEINFEIFKDMANQQNIESDLKADNEILLNDDKEEKLNKAA